MRHLLPAGWRERISVKSAGTVAFDGFPPSELAYDVCVARGIDIADHVSRSLSEEIVGESDIILTMEHRHVEVVRELGGGNRAYLLTGFPARSGKDKEIEDPIGMGIDAYETVFEKLEQEISRVVRHLTSS